MISSDSINFSKYSMIGDNNNNQSYQPNYPYNTNK